MDSNKVSVSVVVPVYSGAKYLHALTDSIAKLRDDWIQNSAPIHIVELIYVDDGSIDGSEGVLDDLVKVYAWIRVLRLSRNFGQHPATIAGILHTCGDWVVTMDEDLQHPPEVIPAMLREATYNQFDVVYGTAISGAHENSIRDYGSRIAKWLTGVLAGDKSVVNFSSFRVIRGVIARSASSVCGYETYFDVALSWFSSRVGLFRLSLKDSRFIEGHRSGYSFWKLLSHARRLIMSCRVKGLRVGAYLGVVAMLCGFAFSIYVVIRELFSPNAFGSPGWGSLIVSNMVFGGLLLFLVSAALEYLSILVLKAQGKPTFFIVDRSSDEMVSSYFKGREV